MKELSSSTKKYLYLTFAAGVAIFVWHMSRLDLNRSWMLVALCLLASLALILKVEGSTNRSHYTFNLLVYGFTFTLYGVPEAILVIVVSNLAEWLWNRPPWFIQLFNACCYIVVAQIAGVVYASINPNHLLNSGRAVLAIVIGMAIFTGFNHLMVGIVVWLARGENFKKSGVFDFFPLILDLTLLYFGASLSFVWTYNHFAILLFLIPIYLIYSTLRVPALERKTEIDVKTGLFNHTYFKQQVENELSRANRFDRPLTVIMADLDLLRNINNTYGHLAGDEVLVGVAKILKQSIREYDVAARFGGEEFAILLPETSIQQAYERAEFIRKAIAQVEFTVPTNALPIRATMSFGIACRESFSQTIDEILHNADMALYHSKLSGRNRAYAYTNDGYVNFGSNTSQAPVEPTQPIRQLVDEGTYHVGQENSVRSAQSGPPRKVVAKAGADQPKARVSPRPSKRMVNLYIGLLALLSCAGLVALFQVTMPLQYFSSISEWLSLLLLSVLIITSEWFSVHLYFEQTALSTSAIAILASYLLFGPIGILVCSLIVAVTLFIKYRSPFSRLIFNFSNHILGGTLCFVLIYATNKQYLEWDAVRQFFLTFAAALIMYLVTTWSISIGMSFDIKQPAHQIWKEQYGWLVSYYLGFGFMAYALVFGYIHAGNAGILLMIVPMALIRFSQKQYIDRTKTTVVELREKNQILKKSSVEILELNESLLEILSEIIDLRDPFVLGHSKQVSHYATEIAKVMKLSDRQIELIRKGSLLHDIGKLGIPENILKKPARLTPEEYEVMKRHAALGADLVGKSPALRPLIPIIRHHHEFFNGKGYPDKLMGSQIPIEARIVALADSIEAMSSERHYRKALSMETVKSEIERHAGSQFDPLVVEAALRVIEPQVAIEKMATETQPDLVHTFVPSS